MPRARPRRRHALISLTVTTVLALVALLPSSIASADTASDQRDVKRKRAEVASQVDTLKANDAQLEQALVDLRTNVRATQAQMSDAQAEADAAASRAEQAETQAAQTEARIEQLRADLVDAAVNAYIDPQADKSLDTFREGSAGDATTKQAYIEATTGSKLDVVDEYRSARQSLEDQRTEAEAARSKAQQRRDSLATTKTNLDTALSQQESVANQVSERLNEKLAESQSLASLDSQLSNQLANEQAALAARLREARSSGGAGGAGGGGGGGTTPVLTRPGLSTVRGITVASSIAGQLVSLLDAASAAGYELGGSGYRDSSGQIALRRENCGTSDYAIYQMPPEQCSPATAIPGRSKHERGLAVDFTIGGHTLRSSDAAYAWMMANAGRFGFVNLPGEPWHFSAGGG
jgi:hypothetical protein